MSKSRALKQLFTSHSRRWRGYLYCYPVISRRSKGLSLGINLNPDGACNFDCIYCQVDRTQPPAVRSVDRSVLESELRGLVQAALGGLFEEPEFSRTPPEFRRINDIAFSGDGEPTISPMFAEAAEIAAKIRHEYALDDAKIVTITDACYLSKPDVAETLAFLDRHNGEIWAKLDAGTEEYFRSVDRPNHTLEAVLENILFAARIRPIVIQTLFMRVDGQPPPAEEIRAYIERLAKLREDGARLSLIQIYTVARRTAEQNVKALARAELHEIADRVRALGVAVEAYA